MITFDAALYPKMANFIQWVIYHPLLWNIADYTDSNAIPPELLIDETTVELGKFIMMGEQGYFNDPSPIRMYGQQRINISKEKIKRLAQCRYDTVQYFTSSKERLSEWHVCGELRGIDLVLVSYISPQTKIICYEPDAVLMSKIREYFTCSNIEFRQEIKPDAV